MGPSFDQLDVSTWSVVRTDTRGANEKYWMREPGTGSDPSRLWLFKPVRIHSNRTVQGGDWAEKIASEIGKLIGVPVAEIEMATRNGVRATLSRNVRPSFDWELHEGGIWLDAQPEAIYSLSGATHSKRVRGASAGYSLEELGPVLRRLGPPTGYDNLRALDGFDVFCGFLLLDALIANRDRHENNWSVLRAAIGTRQPLLAAGYDHEGALGSNLTDAKRRSIEEGSGIGVWASRGTAWRFEWLNTNRVPSLVEAAITGLGMSSDPARDVWIDRISALDATQIDALVDATPRMSEATRIFTTNLIKTNLERLTHELRNVVSP